MSGAEQSPIQMRDAISAVIGPLALKSKPVPCRCDDARSRAARPAFCTGQGMDFCFERGSSLEIDGVDYELAEGHFHRPAEHLVDGKRYAMELHLVFVAKQPARVKGRLAVIGVLIDEGARNELLEPLLHGAGAPALDLGALLAGSLGSYYRYAGSLTTSPFSEIVTWSVLAEPITMSPAQLAAWAQRQPDENARPVQPTNRRFVLKWDG